MTASSGTAVVLELAVTDLVTLSISHIRNNSSMSILIELKIIKHSPFFTNSP